MEHILGWMELGGSRGMGEERECFGASSTRRRSTSSSYHDVPQLDSVLGHHFNALLGE